MTSQEGIRQRDFRGVYYRDGLDIGYKRIVLQGKLFTAPFPMFPKITS